MIPWAFAVFALSAATVAIEPLSKRVPAARSKAAASALVALSVLAAVGAIFFVIEVGHSGAKAAWDDLPAASADHDD
ncbi:MAG: hypothetical protein R2710_20565 [Acidimicrobiales bacterium]